MEGTSLSHSRDQVSFLSLEAIITLAEPPAGEKIRIYAKISSPVQRTRICFHLNSHPPIKLCSYCNVQLVDWGAA